MKTDNILSFLTALAQNNNREWFADNKDWYQQAKNEFEQLGTQFITHLGAFDKEIQYLEVKDCMFRIYRDTRFSHNKTPYKTHFAIYVAAKGGRKSLRSGYYLHIEPNNSMCACGVWAPPAPQLKAIRQSIYENVDEFLEIINEPEFKKYFPRFWDYDKLKLAPKGFSKDWEHIDLIRNKHYVAEFKITDKEILSPNFIKNTADKCALSLPLNRFLNYAIDEAEEL